MYVAAVFKDTIIMCPPSIHISRLAYRVALFKALPKPLYPALGILSSNSQLEDYIEGCICLADAFLGLCIGFCTQADSWLHDTEKSQVWNMLVCNCVRGRLDVVGTMWFIYGSMTHSWPLNPSMSVRLPHLSFSLSLNIYIYTYC